MFMMISSSCATLRPSPTLSPTDPVPRGLLTLCLRWRVRDQSSLVFATAMPETSAEGGPDRIVNQCLAASGAAASLGREELSQSANGTQVNSSDVFFLAMSLPEYVHVSMRLCTACGSSSACMKLVNDGVTEMW